MSKMGRVLVAMSGGIDSSVTALMLHEQGYEVIGITMKTWDYATTPTQKKTTGCCSLDDIHDARDLAVTLGFPHYILDIREEFGDHIIDNFVDEYLAGRTPNPCVMCNTHIKWDALMKRADQLDCEFIATGHYAQVRAWEERFVISKGLDHNKDQSYVLWGLPQDKLRRTIFPVGKFEKKAIRQMAFDAGFKALAAKGESYEICFIPDNDYRSFLKHKVEGLADRLKDGEFLDTQGKVIGKHDGYPFFTIGQRKGLGIALGAPAFVTAIDPNTNQVTLGTQVDLMETRMQVRNVNLIKYAALKPGHPAHTKIRYKDAGHASTLFQTGNKMEVVFEEPVMAITPGQSAVFYEGDDVLGGGFIEGFQSSSQENV
jgi:tRNA-uridine 2-sulfurtransferase